MNECANCQTTSEMPVMAPIVRGEQWVKIPSKRPKARFYYYAANHLCDATKSRKFETN
jgi:hypothetical protein